MNAIFFLGPRIDYSAHRTKDIRIKRHKSVRLHIWARDRRRIKSRNS